MIVRLRGNIERLLPTSLELEVNGITYFIEISLITSTELQGKKEVTLEIAQIIKEDSNLLYGFISREDREIFLRIIKINGIGPKIALTILSSYNVNDFLAIISTNNLSALKSIKGVGAKMAGKIMLELAGYTQNMKITDNGKTHLAFEALSALGFKDAEINAVLQNMQKEILELAPNEIVKVALQNIGKR